jgi:hypothetical protein
MRYSREIYTGKHAKEFGSTTDVARIPIVRAFGINNDRELLQSRREDRKDALFLHKGRYFKLAQLGKKYFGCGGQNIARHDGIPVTGSGGLMTK